LPKKNDTTKAVFRVLDANINRLREALRVIEEYFRFFELDGPIAVQLKQLRHSLEEIEQGAGATCLLEGRDIHSDPFANVNRPEEMGRQTAEHVLSGNFKRAQEASRVIEEYAKISPAAHLSEKAKTIRFTLYDLEKQYMGKVKHG
jgi:thiamine-phosphate pyrophosphorylase